MTPKRYRTLHITPGIVDYTDGDQRETVLIKKPALDSMNRSFLGKPVFNFTHKVIEPEVAFNFTSEESEKHAVGVISDVGYDAESGYYFADMMIWDKDTQDNIDKKGYGVSNAYIPEVGPAGVYNNVPYDEEVTGGEYHHMAVVDNPRYGDVKIFENSKGVKPMKFFWQDKKKEDVKKNAADLKKEEGTELNPDSVIVMKNGSEVPISEMVELYKNATEEKKKEEEEKKEPTMNMEDTIEIDGKKISMKELVDNYLAKKNMEDDEDKSKNEGDKDDKKGVKENSSAVEKPNDKFMMLKSNANQGAAVEKIKIITAASRIKVGEARYGTKVNIEGGK